MSKLIAVTPYGPDGASSRVRVLDWLRFLDTPAEVHNYVGLASNSVRSLTKHPVAAARAEVGLRGLAGRVGGSNLILSKQASPLSNGSIESTLLSKAAHSAYDFDDAIMYEGSRLVTRAFDRARIWRSAVGSADVVIAGNSFLAEVAAHERPRANVTVIPSCVDPVKYEQNRRPPQGEPPTAVWLGSPSTEQYLDDIAPALEAAHDRHGLKLTVISSGRRTLPLPDAAVARIQWHPGIEYRLGRFGHFGIMPLKDDVYARGKCAYKLLQYGAAHLPAIVSPVGANAEVASRFGSLTAGSTGEWVDCIEEMIGYSDTSRDKLGTQARISAEENYSFQAWRPTWEKAVGLS